MNGEIKAVRHTGKPSRLREDKYVRILCIFIFTMLNLFISYPMHAKKPIGLKSTGICTTIKKTNSIFYFTGSTFIDFYKHNMDNVDLDDQLRNHCRYDFNWSQK